MCKIIKPMRSLFFKLSEVERLSLFFLPFIGLIAAFMVFGYTSITTAADVGYGNGDYDPLPDTGQTKCYDVSGNEITCPAHGDALYGQDANYLGKQKSFTRQTINGDEVVVDKNTKLMWQKADDGVTRTWQGAIDYCDALSFGGYTDWRLPEMFELKTIADYGRLDPAIDTSVFDCRSSYYWSATTNANSTDSAWNVYFNHGNGYWSNKTDFFYVRCVRAGV